MSGYAGLYPTAVYPGQKGYINPYRASKPPYHQTYGGDDKHRPSRPRKKNRKVGTDSPIAIAFRRDVYMFSPSTGDETEKDLKRSQSDGIRRKKRQENSRRRSNSDPDTRRSIRFAPKDLGDHVRFRDDRIWEFDVGTQVDDGTRTVGTDPRVTDAATEPMVANVATSTHWKPYVERHATLSNKSRKRGRHKPLDISTNENETVDRGMQTFTPPTSPGFATDRSTEGLTSDTDRETHRPRNRLLSGTDYTSDSDYQSRRRGHSRPGYATDESETDKHITQTVSPRSRRVGVTEPPHIVQGKSGKKKNKKVRVASPREIAANYNARLQKIQEESEGRKATPRIKNTHKNTNDLPDDLKSLSAKHYLEQIGRLDTGLDSQSNNVEKGDTFVMDGKTKPVYVLKSRGSSGKTGGSAKSRSSSNSDMDARRHRLKSEGESDVLDHLDDIDIVEEYDGNDIYLCYLVTEGGAAIGPMRLDIEDIQIGLPGMNKGNNSKNDTDNEDSSSNKGGNSGQEDEETQTGQEGSSSGDEDGLRNRQTGSHGLNEFSSRSHSMLTVTIDSETQPDQDDDNLYITKRGKLSFVDLAGSEKVKDNSMGSGAGVMYESNSINKSLLVLGNCISHLGDSKRRHGHIPYRDSKLTKLLADSLGGNGVTLMITCITPSSYNVTETMNTLRYASRAKKIKTKPTVKMDPREKLIVSLKREIKILRNENHYLRQQLEFPAKPKGQLQKENDEKFMKFMKEQQQKESGLYEMLQEYMVENENLRGENSDLHSTRDKIRREQQLLYRENEKLMKRVEDLERVVATSPSTWQQHQQQQRPLQRYEGFNQYDMGSPRQSPGQNGHRRTSIPNRLPHQDLPHPDPARGVVLSPPGAHPMRPPHRLPDPIPRGQQGNPEGMQNGGYQKPQPAHVNGPNRQGPRRHGNYPSYPNYRFASTSIREESYASIPVRRHPRHE